MPKAQVNGNPIANATYICQRQFSKESALYRIAFIDIAEISMSVTLCKAHPAQMTWSHHIGRRLDT